MGLTARGSPSRRATRPHGTSCAARIPTRCPAPRTSMRTGRSSIRRSGCRTEGEPLAVGTVAHEGRITARLHGAKDIGAQHDAVVHRDRHVPVDAHAVTDFAFVVAHVASLKSTNTESTEHTEHTERNTGSVASTLNGHWMRTIGVRSGFRIISVISVASVAVVLFYDRTSLSSNQSHIVATPSVR